MNLTKDTNAIFEQMKRDARPAAKMECGLEVISLMNATNNAVMAYDMGRRAAIADRRFYLVGSIINGYMAKWGQLDIDESRLIKKAIKLADETIKELNEIEQKEFDDFCKLK